MIKRDDFRRGIGKLIENLIRGISVRSTPRVSSRDEKRGREGRRGALHFIIGFRLSLHYGNIEKPNLSRPLFSARLPHRRKERGEERKEGKKEERCRGSVWLIPGWSAVKKIRTEDFVRGKGEGGVLRK